MLPVELDVGILEALLIPANIVLVIAKTRESPQADSSAPAFAIATPIWGICPSAIGPGRSYSQPRSGYSPVGPIAGTTQPSAISVSCDSLRTEHFDRPRFHLAPVVRHASTMNGASKTNTANACARAWLTQ